MRKSLSSHWIKLHTVGVYQRGPFWASDGLVALVDGQEAGVVGFSCDSYFGYELGIDTTEPPPPEQLFDIPECVSPWDYINRSDYINHPKIMDFEQEIAWLWEGTKEELYYAAKNYTDLMFPTRKICPEDSDYREMFGLYNEIKKYLRKKDRKKKKHFKKEVDEWDFDEE